ncbi:hypothetical protein M011DRAFT_514204, partial [Sporormia fimetaria CBS 119925]
MASQGYRTGRRQQPTASLANMKFVSIPHPRHEIEGSRWAERGWTYQEVMLSRRRLIFTDTQVYFQCAVMSCMETISPRTERRPFNPAICDKEKYDRPHLYCNEFFTVHLRCFDESENTWVDFQNYYERNLTFETDRLNAIQGI